MYLRYSLVLTTIWIWLTRTAADEKIPVGINCRGLAKNEQITLVFDTISGRNAKQKLVCPVSYAPEVTYWSGTTTAKFPRAGLNGLFGARCDWWSVWKRTVEISIQKTVSTQGQCTLYLSTKYRRLYPQHLGGVGYVYNDNVREAVLMLPTGADEMGVQVKSDHGWIMDNRYVYSTSDYPAYYTGLTQDYAGLHVTSSQTHGFDLLEPDEQGVTFQLMHVEGLSTTVSYDGQLIIDCSGSAKVRAIQGSWVTSMTLSPDANGVFKFEGRYSGVDDWVKPPMITVSHTIPGMLLGHVHSNDEAVTGYQLGIIGAYHTGEVGPVTRGVNCGGTALNQFFVVGTVEPGGLTLYKQRSSIQESKVPRMTQS